MTDLTDPNLNQPVPEWLYFLRLLPRWLPCKTRLINLLLKRMNLMGPVEVRLQELKLSFPCGNNIQCWETIAQGAYEADTCAVIQGALPRDGVFLDVGANVGLMTVQAASAWCPQGRVIAIEGSPKVSRWLGHNVSVNGLANVQIVQRAVTAKSGDEVLFYDVPDEKLGMSALVNRFHTEGVAVRTITLDDAVAQAGLDRVDVIKIDVEGHELAAFQGAARLLAQEKPPLIIFEFNDWAENQPENGTRPGDAQRFLLQQGYRLQSVADFLAGRPPGTQVLESGFAEIVATRP